MKNGYKTRLFALLLAAALLLTGCSNSVPAGTEAPAATSATKASASELTADTPEPTTEPEEAPTPEPTEVPTPSPTPAPTEEEKWDAFEKEFCSEYLKQDVVTLHQLVIDPDALGLDVSGAPATLGRYDKEEFTREIDFCLAFYEKLRAINPEELPTAKRAAYETVEAYLVQTASGEEWYGYFEPLTPYTGVQADLPLVLWLFRMDDREDAELYLELVKDAPAFLKSLGEYETYRAQNGLFMRESALDGVLEDIAPMQEEGSLSFLNENFTEKLSAMEGFTDEERAALKTEHEAAVAALENAFGELYALLENLREFCQTGAATEKQQQYFAYMLKVMCNEEVSLDDAESLLFQALADDWRTAYDDYVTMQADPEKFPEVESFSAGTVEENMAYLEALLKDVLPAVGTPGITYKTVPESLKNAFPSAAYLVPPVDGGSESVILLGAEEDDELLLTLAHEGWYGHLYQHTAMREQGASLSQSLLEAEAYAEAFSQMSEILVAEHADLYPTEELRYTVYEGLMQSDMMAYISILVNGRGWTLEEFEKYASDTFGYPKYTADYLYGVAADMPYYYLPYAYGIARICDIQEKTGLTDVKAFYEACLEAGPTGFDILEELLTAR